MSGNDSLTPGRPGAGDIASAAAPGKLTLTDVWPPPGQPFTSEILEQMPDDGRWYELLSGSLFVGPHPSVEHQLVVGNLAVLLSSACPGGLHAVIQPAVRLSANTEFVPDVVVIRQDQIAGVSCATPPLLVAELRSPTTTPMDLEQRQRAYERFGVPSYWIVIPDPAAPEVIALELRDGHYTETAHVTGGTPLLASQPFAATIVPADLVAGLPGEG